MKLLNRSAFSLLPNQPFVDWANSLPVDEDGMNTAMTLLEHRQEGSVYLIEEVDCPEAFEKAVEENWQVMFQNELSAWDEFADDWPEPLTRELFEQWFEWVPQVLAFDLAKRPLMTAALDV